MSLLVNRVAQHCILTQRTQMAMKITLKKLLLTEWLFLGAALGTFHTESALSAGGANPSDVCGAPIQNAKQDRATFLWKDCDGTERWHLRVTGGGTAKTLTVTGAVQSTGGVSGLVPVSLEADDVLDSVTNPNQLSYALRVFGAGTDGFDFGVATNACFTPGGSTGLPTYLGAGRVPLSTSSLDLSTVQACTSLGSSSIAFQDVTVASGVSGNAVTSWGAAWGDLNGDGYPDLFTSNHGVPGRLLQNNGGGTFNDVTAAADPGKAILNSKTRHGGVWADVDNDGDQDLTVAVGLGDPNLLINTNGVLRDQAVARGMRLGFMGESRTPVYFDLNNDGLLDLKLTNWQERASNDTLFVQNADNTFTKPLGSDGVHCMNSDWAQLIDLNGTGPLELLCSDQTGFPSAVYDLATGVGVKLPVARVAQGIDALSGDFDGDLRPDLVIIRGVIRPTGVARVNASRLEAHFFIGAKGQYGLTVQTAGSLMIGLNAGNWSLLVPPGGLNYVYIGAAGYHPTSGQLALAPADSKNAGIQDPSGRTGLFIGYDSASGQWRLTFAARNQRSNGYFVIDSDQPIGAYTLSGLAAGDGPMTPVLLRNTSNGLVDSTAGSGLTPVHCVSGVAGDFDNDMDLDLFLACRDGAQNLANVTFENLGNGTFRQVAVTGAEGPVGPAISASAGTSDSVVTADYDEDGFLDLFVTNGLNLEPADFGGDNQLFRNVGNSNRWLEFDLAGTTSNRDGIGAKVYVTSPLNSAGQAQPVTQYREQNGGYHRWSQNSMRMHVGLASNTQADVSVLWPDGITRTSYSALPANHIYRLYQDGSSQLIH